MQQPTNLNEYYTSQGKTLPSISERQNIAGQAGIQGYTGSAAQNQTLLNYLKTNGSQSSSQTGISSEVPKVIPAGVALGNVKPIDLPNKPVSTAPSTASNNANAYMSSLTGVKGIDNANKAIYDLMSSSLNNPELATKLSKANELKAKADLYNEEYRKKAEEARVNPMLGAETLNSRLGALERERAFTAGTLAIEAAAANQDYTSLKSLLNDQMQIELEPLKFNRDFASDMYKRTQDQAFQRQMKAEDRAYEAKKAQLELANNLKLSTMGIMSPKKAEAFVKDTTAKQASARAGVIAAVESYNNLLTQYKGPSNTIDFNRLTNKEKAELKTALNTTVGSAINVAQGQGAMGDAEAKRILGDLEPSRWTRTSVFNSAAQGVIGAQRDLLKNDLKFLEVEYPGVSNISQFSSALGDEAFFSNTGSGLMVAPENYYNGI